MSYAIPHEVLRGGKNNCCYNDRRSTKISELDKEIARKLYPQGGPAIGDGFTLASAKRFNIPALSNGEILEDYVQRLRVDLNSDDTATRRDARMRLAAYASKYGNDAVLERLTEKLPDQSYRTQLGVAVALRKAQLTAGLSDKIKSNLQTGLDNSTNDLISENLKAAIDR